MEIMPQMIRKGAIDTACVRQVAAVEGAMYAPTLGALAIALSTDVDPSNTADVT